MKKKHLICFSGGHASAIVSIYCVEMFGKDNVILLNHDINPKYEAEDIKRFKKEVADYLGLPITYANINYVSDPNLIPSQFEVCIKANAITDFRTSQALCTNRLKTAPFLQYLEYNFPTYDTLFETQKDCILYYGFDDTEKDRIQRRSSIMGGVGYKTAFPIAFENLRITDTNQIGIAPPITYRTFIHANCIGCLKAGLLHWYVTYVLRPDVYNEGIDMENQVDFTIHRITRNKVAQSISLSELAPIFKQMKADGV
ncbi:hypothetical protein AY601_4073 [Pedobacter cryoconitis]|uniref:Phosphoadenosine phosphosulphate reductase domain-containing protein n=1 Tax=Pedobacter cryoconitis TaxID=188932 RepID=A0A127VHW5_9SPHI|nr:hypothetical protein [Pedobacter cryoconitis]AMQ00924.1 hypothetical protein AY601_4073 [Pedobacter cryoconitis]